MDTDIGWQNCTDKTKMIRIFSLQRIDIHMGKGDVNGSEHTINGKRFPMEVIIILMKFKISLCFQLQLLAYNSDLYTNFSSASKSPHGIAGISILVDVRRIFFASFFFDFR